MFLEGEGQRGESSRNVLLIGQDLEVGVVFDEKGNAIFRRWAKGVKGKEDLGVGIPFKKSKGRGGGVLEVRFLKAVY